MYPFFIFNEGGIMRKDTIYRHIRSFGGALTTAGANFLTLSAAAIVLTGDNISSENGLIAAFFSFVIMFVGVFMKEFKK